MRKRVLVICLILLIPILSGCWDYEEYEDMVQVLAIGVDYNPTTRQTTISIQYLPVTKQANGGSNGVKSSPSQDGVVHSATAKSVFGAINKLQSAISHRLFYGYLRVVLVGEDAAKSVMLNIAEQFDRTPSIRSTAYMAVVPGKAQDCLATYDVAHTDTTASEIYKLIELSNQTGAAIPVSIQDFTAMLAIGGLEATLPRVITVSKQAEPDNAGSDDGLTYDEGRPGDNRISGMAAFKKDKFIGWLDDRETLGLRWILGKNTVTYETTNVTAKATPKDFLVFHIRSSKSKIKSAMQNGKPGITVNVEVVANLRKYYAHQSGEFLSPKEKVQMERQLANSVHADIEAALRKGQKQLKTDIFGFGFTFHRHNTKLWHAEYEEKWAGIFPNVPVKVNVKTKVINVGTNIRELQLR